MNANWHNSAGNAAVIGYSREGIEIYEGWSLCFHPFTFQWDGWCSTLVAFNLESNYTATRAKRPYAVIRIGPVIVQSGWLFRERRVRS